MSSTFLHMDMASIFVGDENPNDALFLTIKNVKLPDLEETTKEHTGGGAAGVIELGTRLIRPFSLTFQLEGFDPARYADFMPSGPGRITYTVRANQRDVKNHRDIPVMAVITGRMTKMSTSEFTRENGVTSDYEIKEVFFYKLHQDGQEKLYFDYLAGPAGVRRNGQLVMAAAARNLGLV